MTTLEIEFQGGKFVGGDFCAISVKLVKMYGIFGIWYLLGFIRYQLETRSD